MSMKEEYADYGRQRSVAEIAIQSLVDSLKKRRVEISDEEIESARRKASFEAGVNVGLWNPDDSDLLE